MASINSNQHTVLLIFFHHRVTNFLDMQKFWLLKAFLATPEEENILTLPGAGAGAGALEVLTLNGWSGMNGK